MVLVTRVNRWWEFSTQYIQLPLSPQLHPITTRADLELQPYSWSPKLSQNQAGKQQFLRKRDPLRSPGSGPVLSDDQSSVPSGTPYRGLPHPSPVGLRGVVDGENMLKYNTTLHSFWDIVRRSEVCCAFQRGGGRSELSILTVMFGHPTTATSEVC